MLKVTSAHILYAVHDLWLSVSSDLDLYLLVKVTWAHLLYDVHDLCQYPPTLALTLPVKGPWEQIVYNVLDPWLSVSDLDLYLTCQSHLSTHRLRCPWPLIVSFLPPWPLSYLSKSPVQTSSTMPMAPDCRYLTLTFVLPIEVTGAHIIYNVHDLWLCKCLHARA